MVTRVKVGETEYNLEDKDAALIITIQELTTEIKKARMK